MGDAVSGEDPAELSTENIKMSSQKTSAADASGSSLAAPAGEGGGASSVTLGD